MNGTHTWGLGDDKFFNPRGKKTIIPSRLRLSGMMVCFPPRVEKLIIPSTPGVNAPCTPKGNHSYGPFFLEYSLLAEYNLLQKQKLPGVYVIPSRETSLCKYKVISIKSTNQTDVLFCCFGQKEPI